MLQYEGAHDARIRVTMLNLSHRNPPVCTKNLRIQVLHSFHGREIRHRWNQRVAHAVQHVPDPVSIHVLLRSTRVVLHAPEHREHCHVNHHAGLVRSKQQLATNEPHLRAREVRLHNDREHRVGVTYQDEAHQVVKHAGKIERHKQGQPQHSIDSSLREEASCIIRHVQAAVLAQAKVLKEKLTPSDPRSLEDEVAALLMSKKTPATQPFKEPRWRQGWQRGSSMARQSAADNLPLNQGLWVSQHQKNEPGARSEQGR
mmetsp:Transcript_5410/g.15481  ORF Transcript_5410/g.15481 Transcript_5410/m.15481 type:complete len:258 (-) Transcript_5410:102-875(-)